MSCPFKEQAEKMKDNPKYKEEEDEWYSRTTYKEKEEMGFPSFYTLTSMMVHDYFYDYCNAFKFECVGEDVCPIMKK